MILTVNGAPFDISWYESSLKKAFSIGQFELKEPTYPADYDGEIRYTSSSLSTADFTGKTLNFNKVGRVLLSAKFEGSDYYQDAALSTSPAAQSRKGWNLSVDYYEESAISISSAAQSLGEWNRSID